MFFQVLHWFTSCFRANTIANTLVTANSFLTPTPYYPTPICGPLFLGTLSSSFGIFFPTDLGLKPISNGVPWGFQAAFISSAFFHLLVYDKEGFLGQTMRLDINIIPDAAWVKLRSSWLFLDIFICTSDTSSETSPTIKPGSLLRFYMSSTTGCRSACFVWNVAVCW